MLFGDLLHKKEESLISDFDKLYQLAGENQTHPGDLLLVRENGFYDIEIDESNNFVEKLDPYVMGPGMEGHAEHTHYEFIKNYVNNNASKVTLKNYLQQVKYDENRLNEIKGLETTEALTIQTEMLIYLKIWESDSFIKTFYQLALLMDKKPYDWHFKIKESNRNKDATGTREHIIRLLIRDKFKNTLPKLYQAFNLAFKTQVRNAIAHSQYILVGRHITLLNYIKDDPNSQLEIILFDDWIEIFHTTIIIHSLYNKLLSLIGKGYENVANHNQNEFEIRVSKIVQEPAIFYRKIEFDPTWKDWR